VSLTEWLPDVTPVVREGTTPTVDCPLTDRRVLVDSRTRVRGAYTVRLALDEDETGYDLTVHEGGVLRVARPGLGPAYLDASVEALLAEFLPDLRAAVPADDD
jgi:hypothetical protein